MSYQEYEDGYTGRTPPLNNHHYRKGRDDAKIPQAPMSKESFDLWVENYLLNYGIVTPTATKHPTTSTGAMREKLNAKPYDLIPFLEFTEAFARVAEHGAEKYEAWNWSKGLSRVQLLGSMLRHSFAYMRGEERDKLSGLLHTDHILWNATVLSHNVHHNLEDGRRVEPVRDYQK